MSDSPRKSVGFIETLATLYYGRTPGWLLRAVNRFVEPGYAVARRACEIALDLFPRVEVVSVPDAGSPGLLVAGRGDVREIFFGRTGLKERPVQVRGRGFIWNLSRPTAGNPEPVTLIEADRCYRHLLSRRGYLAIPEWVLFEMDLSSSWPDLGRRWRRDLAENMRRVVKHGFSCRVEHRRDGLREFYDRMYLPYISTRYGGSARLASRAYLENVWERGLLLIATWEGEDVGGFLISTATRRPLVAFMGIKDADFRHVKRGAVSALYLFTMQWAKEHGYDTLDFGHSRPFLDDGLFQYKRRWGMRVVPSPRKPRTLFVRRCAEPTVVAFLGQPLITYDRRAALVGVGALRNPVSPSPAAATPTC